MDECCRLPAEAASVRDQLLRWHSRQYVFANMRGAGEPIFETDFLPGADMVGEIRVARCQRREWTKKEAAKKRAMPLFPDSS